MRHPPRSVLLAVADEVALVGAVTVPALHVSGNELVDADGTPRRLLGEQSRRRLAWVHLQRLRGRELPELDRDLSCLGWTWNTWNCSSGPALISGYDGTPTAYGIGLRDRLRVLDS